MTLQERELLQARLQIAAGQTLIEARELEECALELTRRAKNLREQNRILDDAERNLWMVEIDDNEED